MTRKGRGRFVALEGIDGVGKSTLARVLARTLRRQGWSVAVRREPADPRLGALAQRAAAEDAWTGAVYFTVDRHLALAGLERDLRRFDVVLQDRSYFSTLAYQGSALSARDRRRLTELEESATRTPDRVVLLDLDPADAVRRLGRRSLRRGPLEQLRTLRRVAKAYRALARAHGWQVLDARGSPQDLARAVVGRLGLEGSAKARSAGRRRR